MKIYVASSWRNPYQPEVIEELRKLGHEVYDFRNPKKGDNGFHWSEIDPLWEFWTPDEYVKCLLHPIAEKGFKSDFDAMNWADCCVMVLPCGSSAHTEAGWMKGKGKPVFVFIPIKQEPELMYKIYDDVFTCLDDLNKIASLTEQINSPIDKLLSEKELSDEEIEEWADKKVLSLKGDPYIRKKYEGLIEGAKAYRDGKIKATQK